MRRSPLDSGFRATHPRPLPGMRSRLTDGERKGSDMDRPHGLASPDAALASSGIASTGSVEEAEGGPARSGEIKEHRQGIWRFVLLLP